jgi:hypothetical protein
MRFGCGGCLSMLVLLMAAVSVGMAWTIARCLGQPDVPIPAATAVESRRAQQKLAEMFQRPRSPGSRPSDPIVFSEGEINALLARNVEEIRGARLRGSVVRLIGSDHVDIYRSLPMTRVLDTVGLGEVSRYLPSEWRERAVWWRISTRVRNTSRPDGRRWVSLDVEALALGNQPLPPLLARVLLDPKLLETLSFELPGGVESIAVEPGRALVRRSASAAWRHGLPLAQGSIVEMLANLLIGSLSPPRLPAPASAPG